MVVMPANHAPMLASVPCCLHVRDLAAAVQGESAGVDASLGGWRNYAVLASTLIVGELPFFFGVVIGVDQ